MNVDKDILIDSDSKTLRIWEADRGERGEHTTMSWECVEELYFLIQEEKDAIKLEKMLEEIKEDEDRDIPFSLTTARVLKRVIARSVEGKK